MRKPGVLVVSALASASQTWAMVEVSANRKTKAAVVGVFQTHPLLVTEWCHSNSKGFSHSLRASKSRMRWVVAGFWCKNRKCRGVAVVWVQITFRHTIVLAGIVALLLMLLLLFVIVVHDSMVRGGAEGLWRAKKPTKAGVGGVQEVEPQMRT